MAAFGGAKGPTSGAGGGYRAAPGKPGMVIGAQGVVKSKAQAGLAKVSTPKGPGSGGLRNAPTFNYTNPMSDQQLQSAAGSIAGAQTVAPLDQLAKQIARNNAQTDAAQKSTAGYYSGLGNMVNSSNQQVGQISSGLNSQLAQQGQDTQSTLAKAFAPGAELVGLDKQGLGGGGAQSLAQGLARAQGTAAQNSGTAQAFGATQGANAQTLGAQNLGTFGLKGQEGITSIGRAGQLRNVPLADKQAGLIANRGNLYATALGSLKSAERNYGISKQTLALNLTKAQLDAAAKAAATAASLANNQLTNRTSASNNAASNAQSNTNNRRSTSTSSANNQRSTNQSNVNSQRSSGAKAQKPATGEGASTDLAADLQVGTAAYGKVGTAKNKDGSPVTAEQAHAYLQSKGLTPPEIQAALELHTIGSVQPGTYQALVNQQHGKLNMPGINQGTRVPVAGAAPPASAGAGSTGTRPT